MISLLVMVASTCFDNVVVVAFVAIVALEDLVVAAAAAY